jgi:hypothetical protein
MNIERLYRIIPSIMIKEAILRSIYPADQGYWEAMSPKREQEGVAIAHTIANQIGVRLPPLLTETHASLHPESTKLLASMTETLSDSPGRPNGYEIIQRKMTVHHDGLIPSISIGPSRTTILTGALKNHVLYTDIIMCSNPAYPCII